MICSNHPIRKMDKERLMAELRFRAVRSGGAGGQHVNKVASKVILELDLLHSSGLSKEEKSTIRGKLGGRINVQGVLSMQCDEDRSQLRNKEIVTKRFFQLLEKALVPAKVRRATRIPKSAVEKRLKEKKRMSDIKSLRKNRNL